MIPVLLTWYTSNTFTRLLKNIFYSRHHTYRSPSCIVISMRTSSITRPILIGMPNAPYKFYQKKINQRALVESQSWWSGRLLSFPSPDGNITNGSQSTLIIGVHKAGSPPSRLPFKTLSWSSYFPFSHQNLLQSVLNDTIGRVQP